MLQLEVFRRERLHDPHSVDVLVDDGGDVGQARLDEPRHREHLLPHADADDVDERHRRHRHQRERHVDRQHLREREQRDAALHEDARREREVHLHRTDVGVRARDELTRLHPVVERERHAAQVLVHDVAQVVFDAVRGLQQVVARHVREHEADRREHHDDGDEVLERLARRLRQRVDRLTHLVGDLHLHREPQERRDQREAEHPLVREHDGHDPAQPRATPVGLDVRARWWVPGGHADGHERRAHVGAERAHLDGHESRLTCASRLRSSARFHPSSPAASASGGSSTPGSSNEAAISSRRASPAASAAARRRLPSRVSSSVSRRRSSGSARRSTSPRADQAVDHRGHRRRAHRELAGQHRRRGRAVGEQREHPVLREREVERRERHLHLLRQPGHGPRRAGRRSGTGSSFDTHMVRVSKYLTLGPPARPASYGYACRV